MPSLPIEDRVGNEHDPTDPFGRVNLVITETGEVRLEHVSRAGRRAWTAVATSDALASIEGALDASGFPIVPPAMPLPDSGGRMLTVAGVARRIESRAAGLPGYAELFAVLDALADEVSGGTIYGRPRTGLPLVSSISRS
jgi:hypothetical protein